jgi:hypothetical protein
MVGARPPGFSPGQYRQHRPGDTGGDDHVDPAIAVEQELHDYRSPGAFSEARQVLVERNAQGADRSVAVDVAQGQKGPEAVGLRLI